MYPNDLSPNQISIMKAAQSRGIRVEDLGRLKDPSLHAMLKRQFLVSNGDGRYIPSESGESALHQTLHRPLPVRAPGRNYLSERTARLLRVARLRKKA